MTGTTIVVVNYKGVQSNAWKEVSVQLQVPNKISKDRVLVDEVPHLLSWDIKELNERTIRSHASKRGWGNRKKLMER